MRIAFDARHLQTASRTRGIGRYSRNLLAAFARLEADDVDWTLLRLRNFAPADPSPLPPHRDLRTLRPRRPELAMLALDPVLLSLELATVRPDVYHTVQLGLPGWRRFAAVVTIHDLAPLHWPRDYMRRPHARVGHLWQYALARHADAVIAISQVTKEDVVARLGVDPERVHVIPHAVDAIFASKTRAEGAAVARARLGVEGRYVLYVGQFDPRKDTDALLRAFARAAESDRDLRLVVVGELGKLAPFLFASIDRSRAPRERVVLAGYVDDPTLAALYAGAECLLHAARLEGFGLTPLESLAAGTPVVAYAAPGVAEVVGDAGLLVDATADLGDALVRFLGDAALAARLRTMAKARSVVFSWNGAAGRTLDVYRSVSR